MLQYQVQKLLKNGVPAKNVYLVAFSRGGFITAIASSYLANKELNFAILAACTSNLTNHKDVTLYGHIFSIFETSDSVGSCKDSVRRSGSSVVSFKEVSISTGKEHGAFYRPIEAWVKPIKQWIRR